MFTLRLFLTFLWCYIFVTARRLVRGPLLPGWSWWYESSNHYVKLQTRQGSVLPDMAAQRKYADTLTYRSPVLKLVKREAAAGSPVLAEWYTPGDPVPGRVLLYLHGGGWAFFAKSHHGIIAQMALTARARTLAVDYRLSPENPYPAALEDCLAVYEHLLASGVKPQEIVVGGDSAGGNLTLALLQTLRSNNAPLPALAFLISPCVDVGNSGDSLEANSRYDWVDAEEIRTWCRWYAGKADPRDPLLSPLYADVRNLPPIYIQAGSAECLIDQIRVFADCARDQGADVRLDVWQDMTHDFQAFGHEVAQSREALQRLGQVIDTRFATTKASSQDADKVLSHA